MTEPAVNRGYAGVQVNFRGSTGYGKAFVNAGDKQWARAMHTDLLDAIDHLAAQGTIDPACVAIMGTSYGGYAALVGAAFTPDVFRCAIELCGWTNLLTALASIPPYWLPWARLLHTRIGDPETERDLLRERSPLFAADRIRIPVLVAHGANDVRVKQAEAEQIVAALRANDVPHEYLLFDDEGHGLYRPENPGTLLRSRRAVPGRTAWRPDGALNGRRSRAGIWVNRTGEPPGSPVRQTQVNT